MINKLQYDLTTPTPKIPQLANWNQRPREIANLTHWVANRIEHDLNWQIVTFAAPLRGPCTTLRFSISAVTKLVAFTRDEEAKLREFIEKRRDFAGQRRLRDWSGSSSPSLTGRTGSMACFRNIFFAICPPSIRFSATSNISPAAGKVRRVRRA